MCGIAGILLSPSSAHSRRLDALPDLLDTLRHRGPDGDGVWFDKEVGVALGHRRLAIVDLSESARQPMVSRGGDLIVTYNGEIYNFGELRTELEELGCRFRGHGDTEVMLAAFEIFGIEPALKRFAGMFAAAIWDRRARVLHIMRDRIGKKPLYVTIADGALVFASEPRAFRAFPGFDPKIDPAAAATLLQYGWIPDDQCIWRNVFKLPPGAMLTVSADDLAANDLASIRTRIRTWWSLENVVRDGQRDPLRGDDAELVEKLDQLLRTAVRQRMIADVPLGAFLSGGIDSSTVVALMQAQSERPVRTFTIGFAEAGYDEAEHAQAVARHLGTEHTTWRITPAEARAVIPDLPSIWNEPFADESQIPTFLVSQLARRHVTVALSGDGGDECFGGYRRHLLASRLGGVLRLPLPVRRAGGAALRLLHPDAAGGLLRGMPIPASIRRSSAGRDLEKLVAVMGVSDEGALYDQLISLTDRCTAATAEVNRPYRETRFIAGLPGRLMYRDMACYLPGDVLVKVDRATMAVGLEGRCPLLDHRVVEFAWRLPAAAKVRGTTTKWILRQVLRRYVPDALFERPKAGFNVPIGDWLAGPLRDWANDLLVYGRQVDDGLINHARVDALWRAHLSRRSDHATEIWAVLMLLAWLAADRDRAMSGPVRKAA
jgi:asparagine synthase (glutamine-hydrolysing)